MIEECEGVILEVDSTVKDVSIECIVEELVTVALVTGPMKI